MCALVTGFQTCALPIYGEQFLQGFRGKFLQCDGYDGYDRLTRIQRPQGPWTLVHCWSHLRRRFVKQARNTKSPIAEDRSAERRGGKGCVSSSISRWLPYDYI